MKTLHLLRHAKSSWKESLPDRERGLNKRGRRDAPRMGAALASRLRPLAASVSPAQRAQLTLAGLASGWSGLADLKHVTDEALYTFDWEDLAQWLAGRPDGEDEILLIGHNPALTDLANVLTGQQTLDNLPTAGYLELALPIDRWCDLLERDAVLEYSLFPKELP